ncbi:MAG: DUF2752 domain-containing protein [Capsulimonadales bacterium]|nr:DUF2752 domain-containing protein [Capsulimonadales bacterium]
MNRSYLPDGCRRFGFEGLVLLAAAVVPAPAPGAATVLGVPSLCLFRGLTGLPCPGCGMTRSLVCCAHGRFGDALAFHSLGPPVFFVLTAVVLCRLLGVRPGAGVSRWLTPAAWAVLALLAVAWTARLLGFLPPLPPG